MVTGDSRGLTRTKKKAPKRKPRKLNSLPGWRSLLDSNHECGAAVQAARFLTRIVVGWPLLAVADGL